MTKEAISNKLDLDPLADGLAGTFIQRRDLFARQMDDGSYICIRKPLTNFQLAAHLAGELTLGAYVLDQASMARFLVFDADEAPQFEKLFKLAGGLAKANVPSYLEQSRRGGHLWLFLAKPTPGKDVRLFGKRLAEKVGLTGIEIFPKQDRLAEGPGSLIRLPFGRHRKTGLRYGFITLERKPLAPTLTEQIRILSAPQTVPDAFFRRNLANTRPVPFKPLPEGSSDPKKALSERIKEQISVRDFVSEYVDLAPNGRGKCPFHDDQHSSFAVSANGNYWHCFAGCGGGSVIDFWMKARKCDFSTAVRELAKMLL